MAKIIPMTEHFFSGEPKSFALDRGSRFGGAKCDSAVIVSVQISEFLPIVARDFPSCFHQCLREASLLLRKGSGRH